MRKTNAQIYSICVLYIWRLYSLWYCSFKVMYAFVSRILSTIPLIPVQLLLIKKLNTDVSLLEVFSINSWRSKWPVLRKCWVLLCCFVFFFFLFCVPYIFFCSLSSNHPKKLCMKCLTAPKSWRCSGKWTGFELCGKLEDLGMEHIRIMVKGSWLFTQRH